MTATTATYQQSDIQARTTIKEVVTKNSVGPSAVITRYNHVFWITTVQPRANNHVKLTSSLRANGNLSLCDLEPALPLICRIASKTTLNCLSYLLSSSSSRRESSALDASICRSFTNARMISMLTNMARSLFSTLESIATP